MKFELHFEYRDGTNDSMVVSADSIEEIRDLAKAEVAKRDPVDYWSEQVE